MATFRVQAIGAMAAVAAVAFAGCAGSTQKTGSLPSGTATVSSVSSSTASGGVDPNAPEVKQIGDIPDNAKFVAYSPTNGMYSVTFPEGWSRTGDGDKVSFTDKLNAIEVSIVAKSSQPTIATITSDDLKVLAAHTGNFKLGEVTTVSLTGGSAIVAKYEIDSAPNSVTGKSIRVAVERYEFWKNGKSAVVTLIGAVGADNVDPWRKVTDSFRWTK